jgi:hypothetical protein
MRNFAKTPFVLLCFFVAKLPSTQFRHPAADRDRFGPYFIL